MARETPKEYRVTWTGDALDVLASLLAATRHAEDNPGWVERKLEESVVESVDRLALFPDLRVRYLVAGIKCNGMTLRTLPLQVFYRRITVDEIAVFDLRWASLDKTGPLEFDQP